MRAFTHGPTSTGNFLEALRRDDHHVRIVERDGQPLGSVSFAIVDRWLMEIRTLAFEQQRTGAGRFTLKWLLHHAFEELLVHRVFLEVLERNTHARTLYEDLGFRQEGCYRDGYRSSDGTFHNLIPYGLIAS